MKKGISLAALTATITIMIILITTVVISGNKMSNNSRRSNFATEISTIQKAVDSYMQKNENDYPIRNSLVINLANVSDENKAQFTDNGDIITNNTISLFEIDYDKIGYTDLKFGNKKDGDNDVYVLSAVTGKVYYAKGFVVGSEVYYTLTSDLQKILEYKTTDTIVTGSNDIISYSQENLENSNKKVTIKIPVEYSVTSVKVGDTSYSATSTSEYNIYEVTGVPGTVIDIIYTYNGENVSTSYKIRANNEKTDEGYAKAGLILHYDGINNTGNGHSSTTTVWKDLSGNGNDGTLYNIDNTTVSKWESNGILLDGVNDYIKTNKVVDYKSTNAITIQFVDLDGILYSNRNNGNIYVIIESSRNYNTYSNTFLIDAFEHYSNGMTTAIRFDDYYIKKYKDTVNPKNTLYTYVIDLANKSTPSIKIYKDSELIYAEQEDLRGSNYDYFKNYELFIGARRGEALFSNLKIGNLKIYNRALTEDEIKQNYEIDKVRFGI